MTKRMLFALIALIACASAIHFQHEAGYYWSTVTEKPGGACTSTTECDGVRTCVKGKCTGVARPPKNEAYYYSELQTQSGCPNYAKDPKMANKDYYCDGLRTCVNGKCQGVSRACNLPSYLVAEFSPPYYSWKKPDDTCPSEGTPYYSQRDCFCDGERTCFYGKCKGVARQPKTADYHYDEKQNKDGICYLAFQQSIKDYFCNGLRVCSPDSKRCQDPPKK